MWNIDQDRKNTKRQYDIQYAKEHLKRIPLDVPKALYEKIKAHAATQGETVNGFIKRAIAVTMRRDQAQPTEDSAQQEPAVEEQHAKPTSFLESVKADVEQIVAETDKDTKEEEWEWWKKHNTF